MRTITFYSYKGGTGRTLLLANLAVLAAGIGKKVVALDFDLEAPGLAYKLFPDERPRADGLVGWLRDALHGEGPPAAVDDYLVDVPVEAWYGQGGWLKLMPAGRAPSPNYFQDLRRLRLDYRLDEGSALDALVDLQRRLQDDLGADFLLIDARTGITSTNAVTTHVLADTVVALTLETPEQLEGTRSVLRSLQPFDSIRSGRPIDLHVVLARVPSRPVEAGGITPPEQAQIDRVVATLSEPGQPLRESLDIGRVHLLHTEPALTRGEYLSLAGPGPWTRSLLHEDYMQIARALFGPEVEDAAVAHLGDLNEPEGLEEWARFYVAPAYATEARGDRVREGPPTRDVGATLPDDVAILRRQAVDDLTLRPDLATRLLVLSARWNELGRRQDALTAIEEATSVYRELASENPTGFSADLAGALGKLSTSFAGVGRPVEALAAVKEALLHYRALAEANPARYLPDVATSLNNLSNRLGELGRHDEAVAAIEEALLHYRTLAEANPARYLPDVATSLNNLSVSLG
ncbi:MAG: KGGVGR-motif variant AAA ATPase, partial [Acidimicrobiales bacterium]